MEYAPMIDAICGIYGPLLGILFHIIATPFLAIGWVFDWIGGKIHSIGNYLIDQSP